MFLRPAEAAELASELERSAARSSAATCVPHACRLRISRDDFDEWVARNAVHVAPPPTAARTRLVPPPRGSFRSLLDGDDRRAASHSGGPITVRRAPAPRFRTQAHPRRGGEVARWSVRASLDAPKRRPRPPPALKLLEHLRARPLLLLRKGRSDRGSGDKQGVGLHGDGEAVRPVGSAPTSGSARHNTEVFEPPESPVDRRLRGIDSGRQLRFGSVAGEERREDRSARMGERVEEIRRPAVHVLFNTE